MTDINTFNISGLLSNETRGMITIAIIFLDIKTLFLINPISQVLIELRHFSMMITPEKKLPDYLHMD